MFQDSFRRFILIVFSAHYFFFACMQGVALANPEGGVVVGGAANIASQGNTTTITQSTDRAAINWNSFDIKAGETTEFKQPNANSVALNRVTGSEQRASQIAGNLTANGKVILINPNGILFDKTAKVDVAGLVASTANIRDADFMAGSGALNEASSNKTAQIINKGTITLKESGLGVLVAPDVANEGTITAKLGRVALGGAETATIDFYGNGMVQFAVQDAALATAVANNGAIINEGGSITMTAKAASDLLDSVVTNTGSLTAKSGISGKSPTVINTGILAATTIEEKGVTHEGKVKILAVDAKGKTAGTVAISGIVSATAPKPLVPRASTLPPKKGGTIQISGKNTYVTNALIDVSGVDGGGRLRLGGEYLGGTTNEPVKGLFVENLGTPNAQNTFVDRNVSLLGNAIERGDGGHLVNWADGNTGFYGRVEARGGINAGNGGFVEVSGKEYLDMQGEVDLTPRHASGSKGTLLLDPTDIVISNFAPNDSSVASNLKLWLDASDASTVTLTYSTDALSSATASGTSGTNTLTTSADVSASLAVGARVRLTAAGSVTTASTLGTDTYTIASISGTTITTVETLTSTYSAQTLHRGLVSQWNDKSGQGNNATQATQTNMPLYIIPSINNRYLSLNDDWLDVPLSASEWTLVMSIELSQNSGTVYYPLSTGNLPSQPFSSGVSYGGTFFSQKASLYNGSSSLQSISNAVLNVPVVVAASGSTSNRSIWINSESGASDNVNHTISTVRIGKRTDGNWPFIGKFSELFILNLNISTNIRNLLEQYQSAKWGVALTPPGTGATEAAKAMAADGYSVFHKGYLERLSQSANIALVATNSITINDLTVNGGDGILNLSTASRSLSLTAGAGGITMANTANTLRTNGGAMTFTTTGGGGITLGNLDTTGGGSTAAGANISITSAGGAISVRDVTRGSGGTLIADSTNAGATAAGADISLLASTTTLPTFTSINAGTGGTAVLGRAGAWSYNTSTLDTTFTNVTSGGRGLTTTSGNLTLTGTYANIGSKNYRFEALGGDVILSSLTMGKTSGGTQGVIFRASNSITTSGTNSITSGTGAVNITLNADRDSSGAGAIVLSNTTLSTNAGYVVMGGGSNPDPDNIAGGATPLSALITRPAIGNSAIGYMGSLTGVRLTSSPITTSGGHVSIRGLGGVDGADIRARGVFLSSLTLSTLSGNVYLVGQGGQSSQQDQGLEILNSTLTSMSGSINLLGLSGTANVGNTRGINNNLLNISTTTGDVNVFAEHYAGFAANNFAYYMDRGSILTTTGNITLSAKSVSSSLSDWRTNSVPILGDITTSGNITILGNTYWAGSLFNITTSGAVTYAPSANGTTLRLNGGASGVAQYINSVVLASVTAAAKVKLGDANTGAVTIGSGWDTSAYNFPIEVWGNGITAAGAITTANDLALLSTSSSLASGYSSINSGVYTTTLGRAGAWSYNVSGLDTTFASVTSGGRGLTATSGNLTLTGTYSDIGSKNYRFEALGGDVILSSLTMGKTTGGTQGVIFRASNSITGGGSITSTSGALHLRLNSDSDNNGAGAISLTNTTIITNGGNISLGGGNAASNTGTYDDASVALTDYAVGTTDVGIYFQSTMLSSNGGNIAIRGQGASAGAAARGIYLLNSQLATTTGAISINGVGGTGGSNIGLLLQSSSQITSGSGNITLEGTSPSFDGIQSISINTNIYSATGNIRFNIKKWGASLLSVQTAGQVIYAPYTSTDSIGINGGGGTVAVGNTQLSYITTATLTPSKVVFGDSATGAATIGTGWNTSAYNFPIEVWGNGITAAGAITTANDISLLSTSASLPSGYTSINSGAYTTTLGRAGAWTYSLGTSLGTGVGQTFQNVTAGGWGVAATSSTLLLTGTGSSPVNTTFYSVGDLTMIGTLTSSVANKTFSFRSDNNVLFNAGTVSGGASNYLTHLVLNSDRDANQNGSVQLSGISSLQSDGGNIVVGGGTIVSTNAMPADPASAGSGYAGFRIDNASISSDSGSIYIYGKGATSGSGASYGIIIGEGGNQNSFNSTSGNIFLKAEGGSNSSLYNRAFIFISQLSQNYSVTTTSGDIDIQAIAGTGTRDFDFGLAAPTGSVTLGSGSMTGNITVSTNNFFAASAVSIALNTQGNITIKPYTTSTPIGLGTGATGALNLNTDELGYFNGTGGLIIGDTTAGTGAVDIRD